MRGTTHYGTDLHVDAEIQQSTALRWLAEFLTFASDVLVPFTPRLIPAILPNLAHHDPMIQAAAIRTNKSLLGVIQNLPSPVDKARAQEKSSRAPASPTPTGNTGNSSRQATGKETKEVPSPESPAEVSASGPTLIRPRGSGTDLNAPSKDVPATDGSRSHSPISFLSHSGHSNALQSSSTDDLDPIDYQATVNELTVQFLSEFEETRVAALKWLIMLHQKAPKKVSDRRLKVQQSIYLSCRFWR